MRRQPQLVLESLERRDVSSALIGSDLALRPASPPDTRVKKIHASGEGEIASSAGLPGA